MSGADDASAPGPTSGERGPRVVLFGATGFTGELVARALLAHGVRPVLAGRKAHSVAALAETLGGLEHAVANAEDPGSVRDLVGRGDVLVSTVGPFTQHGSAAVEAAVAAGAHYVDTTGEPPFVRDVFERWDGPARESGSVLLPAMGYDYVPGNLAAVLAADRAGETARRVDVGYFVAGRLDPRALSSGTTASLTGAALAPGFARTGGRLVAAPTGTVVRSFVLDRRCRTGLTVGGSELLTVPQTHPHVDEVRVFLGWFGVWSHPISWAARFGRPVLDTFGWTAPVRDVVEGLFSTTGRGPDAAARRRHRTLVVAEAFDAAGAPLARAEVRGPNPYDITGRLVAWAAAQLAAGRVTRAGALGPATAFGTEGLLEGAAGAGLRTVVRVVRV